MEIVGATADSLTVDYITHPATAYFDPIPSPNHSGMYRNPLALRELDLREWWRVALRELPTGITLGAMLGVIGIVRIAVWQQFGLYDYGEHWVLIGLTVATP